MPDVSIADDEMLGSPPQMLHSDSGGGGGAVAAATVPASNDSAQHIRIARHAPPHFPSTQARSPVPPIILSPSPPASTSTRAPLTSSAAYKPPSMAQSPWHTLAAMAGAPTPATEVPTSIGPRGSPQLGRPFEQLNIGGTWSAANLNQSDESSSPSSSPPPRSRHGVPGGAISGRHAKSAPTPMSMSGLAQRRASAQVTSSPLAASTSSRLKPLATAAVRNLISQPDTLILDIRPPSTFHDSHLPTAHSVPVPSTLLRRPAFSLAKTVQMLTPQSREVVSRWREMSNVIIIDQDSNVAPEGSVLQGITSKFDRENYQGKLWFVVGGQGALEADGSIEMAHEDPQPETPAHGSLDGEAPLGVGRLSRMAFFQGSTLSKQPSHGAMPLTTAAAADSRPDPFQALHLGGSAPVTTRRGARSTDSARTRLQPANPFFDNIRQNLELSHGGITERIPLGLPDEIIRRADELPAFLRSLVLMPERDSMDLLANQFFRIELGEQKRLQSVMDVLTKGSCSPASNIGRDARNPDEIEQLMQLDPDASGYYPFSITAGVERGTKNRYKNIWPYDYSRVRLGTPGDDESDYINASFVQPRGTTRRYIATQGPLDATYRDFWTLVWEQNVYVIVMLTKQFEGGLLKCGKYWCEQQYGNLRLQLESQTGEDEDDERQTTGFDFGPAASLPTANKHGNIKRVFKLSHVGSDLPPRRIVQIQSVNWPDFDVPDSPEILLNLLGEVDAAVEQTGARGCGEDRCAFPPVLVHCSAGVGRTGSYILVDAIADALRREYRAAHPRGSLDSRKSKVSESSGDPFPSSESSRQTTDTSKTVSFLSPPLGSPSIKLVASPRPMAEGEDPMDIDSAKALPRGGSLSSLWASDQSDNRSFRRSPSGTPDMGERPRPVTQSHVRHRPPTPLSNMDEPVLDVLRGMRVQRMSLVQSLRQYVFVHRAIITHFLTMVDHERKLSLSLSDSASYRSRGSNSMSASTGNTSILSTDDEGTFKRKPSATDLQPAMDERLHIHTVENLRLSEGNEGAVNLVKRTSFKKRRAAKTLDGAVPGSQTPSGSTPPTPRRRGGTAD